MMSAADEHYPAHGGYPDAGRADIESARRIARERHAEHTTPEPGAVAVTRNIRTRTTRGCGYVLVLDPIDALELERQQEGL